MTPDHVDWGMSKMTPLNYARASSASRNCFSFSCLLTKRNKIQSQGTKSGEYGGWVTIWTSLAARKSRVTAVVCVLALSWWSSIPRTSFRGRRLDHAWKTLGKQWLTYQSALTVFLSSSGMVATWQFCKETRYHLFGSTFVSFEFNRLAGLIVKASASGAEDPGIESRLRRDFSESSHTMQWLIYWHSSGYPARRLAL